MIGYLIFFIFVFLIDNLKLPLEKKYISAFVVISVFSGIRYGIGYDYFYYYMMIITPGLPSSEPIPQLFLDLARVTHYSVFYILSSIFINFFYIIGLYAHRVPFSAIYFYIGFPSLLFTSFSTIRQHMAFSVIFFLICLNRPNLFKKILIICVAFMCHRSSIITLLLLLPYDRVLNKNSLAFLALISFFIGEVLTNFLLTIASDNPIISLFQFYLEDSPDTGFYKKLIIYILVVMIIIKYQQLINNGVEKKYLNLTILGGILFSLFSVNSHVAERFCMFFFSSIMVYLNNFLKVIKFPINIYKFLCVIMFAMSVYVAHELSSHVGPWRDYRKSIAYPYGTIFENNPPKRIDL